MNTQDHQLRQKRNILIAADYCTPRSGNFIASMLDLADALRAEGRQTIFLFPDRAKSSPWTSWLTSNGYPVFYLNEKAAGEETLSFIRELVTRHEICLIHLHFGLLVSLLLPVHKALGVELVIHDHFDFVTTSNPVRQRLSVIKKALLYRKHDAYCISVMEKKNRWYWLSGKKHHSFIINGLSLRRAEQDLLTREERRQEIGLQDGEKLALFLGWDMERKGLDIAIKAVELFRKTDPSLKLGVIGVGNDGKPSARAEQFLRNKGIDPNTDAVIYMHSYEDIFALNRAADCYISSSRAEAFSYGILEAISQNTPVIVSDITGTGWCWEYSNAYRYAVEDPEDCARAFQKALSAGRAPSNSAALVAKYGNDVWCRRILAVYRQLLG